MGAKAFQFPVHQSQFQISIWNFFFLVKLVSGIYLFSLITINKSLFFFNTINNKMMVFG